MIDDKWRKALLFAYQVSSVFFLLRLASDDSFVSDWGVHLAQSLENQWDQENALHSLSREALLRDKQVRSTREW